MPVCLLIFPLSLTIHNLEDAIADGAKVPPVESYGKADAGLLEV